MTKWLLNKVTRRKVPGLRTIQKTSKGLKNKICYWETNLRIMTAMSEFLEKSKIISSAIFLAFPYGLIGTWIMRSCEFIARPSKSTTKQVYFLEAKQKSRYRTTHLWSFFSNRHLLRFPICCTCTRIYQSLHTMCSHWLQNHQGIWRNIVVIPVQKAKNIINKIIYKCYSKKCTIWLAYIKG